MENVRFFEGILFFHWSYDFSKMLYKFYSLSLMRVEGKCDRPVSLEESTTLAANPCKRRVISLVWYHLYQHCAWPINRLYISQLFRFRNFPTTAYTRLDVYGSHASTLAAARYDSFNKSANNDLRSLPPSKDALHQYLLRACYQAGYLWQQSLEEIDIPDPGEGDGSFTQIHSFFSLCGQLISNQLLWNILQRHVLVKLESAKVATVLKLN